MRIHSVLSVVIPGLLAVAIAIPTDAVAGPDGAALFAQHCASCHGISGAPDPDGAVVSALGVVPANFNDALFNSREPAGDWAMVIEHGGDALGLSDRMPAFGDLLDAGEIDALVRHVKTLAGEHYYPPGDLNLFLPLRTTKAFPEDEVVWKSRYTDRGRTYAWENVLELEKRVGRRGQMLLELVHEVDDGDGRFDKIEPGFKYVLRFVDGPRGSILTAGAKFELPLHGGEEEFVPFLAFGKILGPNFTFQGSSRAKLPFGDFDEGSLELAGIVHWTHSPWPRNLFPGLELVAEIPFDRGPGPDRPDAVQWSIVPQTRIGLTKGGHVALNLGLELPLNERDRYDYRAQMFLIWDFADGPFWKAW